MARIAAGTRLALATGPQSKLPMQGNADVQGLPDANFTNVNASIANVSMLDLMPNGPSDLITGRSVALGTVGAGGTMAVGEAWMAARGNFPCSALPIAIPTGSYILFSNGGGVDDMVPCKAGAAPGATSIPFVNFVAAITRTPGSTTLTLLTGTALIDYLVSKAQARSNGQVKIRLQYADFNPAWLNAYQDTGGIPSPFAICDPVGNTSALCGSWWTTAYQAAVHNCEAQLGAKYDAVAVVTDMDVTAAATVFPGEPTIRQLRDVGQPNNIMATNAVTLGLAGYTQAKDLAAQQVYFTDAFLSFLRTCRSYSFSNYHGLTLFSGPYLISANTTTTITTAATPSPAFGSIAGGTSCAFVARCWGSPTTDPAGINKLIDSSAKFISGSAAAQPVVIGDKVLINNTLSKPGIYTVQTVDSETQLTMTGNILAPGGGTNVRFNSSLSLLGFTYFVLVGTNAGDFGTNNTGSWKITGNTAQQVTIATAPLPTASDLVGAFLFVVTATGLDKVTMDTLVDQFQAAGGSRAVVGNHNFDATTVMPGPDTVGNPSLYGRLQRAKQQGSPIYGQIASDTAVNGNLTAHAAAPADALTQALDNLSLLQPSYAELQGYWMRDFGTSSAGGAGSTTMTDASKLWDANIWGTAGGVGRNSILKFDVSGNIYYIDHNSNTVLTLSNQAGDQATLLAADAAPAAYHLIKYSAPPNGDAQLGTYRTTFAANPTYRNRVAAGSRVATGARLPA